VGSNPKGSLRKEFKMYVCQSYDDSLRQILNQGVVRTNQRTKIKTLSIFGMMSRYRLDTEYFPIITKRKVWPKSVFAELIWFLSGSTSNKDLRNLGCNFWTPWVDEKFESQNYFEEETFGPVYGFQLRHFGGNYNKGIHQSPYYGHGGFDQLKWVVERIKQDYSCRRTLWTLWNPKDVEKMRLPPCHMLFQVLVDDDRRMTGILYQRSSDFPVGVPANIQFYSALTMMIAQQTDCIASEFVHFTADSHIYESQIQSVEKYLSRENPPDSPKLLIKKAKDIFSYTVEDFELIDYNPLDKIEIPVAV
jgi:thymidylate synthase